MEAWTKELKVVSFCWKLSNLEQLQLYGSVHEAADVADQSGEPNWGLSNQGEGLWGPALSFAAGGENAEEGPSPSVCVYFTCIWASLEAPSCLLRVCMEVFFLSRTCLPLTPFFPFVQCTLLLFVSSPTSPAASPSPLKIIIFCLKCEKRQVEPGTAVSMNRGCSHAWQAKQVGRKEGTGQKSCLNVQVSYMRKGVGPVHRGKLAFGPMAWWVCFVGSNFSLNLGFILGKQSGFKSEPWLIRPKNKNKTR